MTCIGTPYTEYGGGDRMTEHGVGGVDRQYGAPDGRTLKELQPLTNLASDSRANSKQLESDLCCQVPWARGRTEQTLAPYFRTTLEVLPRRKETGVDTTAEVIAKGSRTSNNRQATPVPSIVPCSKLITTPSPVQSPTPSPRSCFFSHQSNSSLGKNHVRHPRLHHTRILPVRTRASAGADAPPPSTGPGPLRPSRPPATAGHTR